MPYVDEEMEDLFEAVSNKELDELKDLIHQGCNVNVTNNHSRTLLHQAVILGYQKIIKYLLTIMSNDAITTTDYKGRTAYHLACFYKKPIVKKILAADIRFKQLINVKDIYGKTAADLENQNYNNYSQKVINKILEVYLSQTGRADSVEQLIDENGNCHGWAALRRIYDETQYYDILNLIKNWDQTAAGLEKTILPASLTAQFGKVKYKNHERLSTIGDVFEQVVNDLIWFHHNTNAITQLHLGLSQESREEQYQLVQSKTSKVEQRLVLTFPNKELNRAQLIEVLSLISQWPELKGDCWLPGHTTELEITADHQLNYNDSNHDDKVPNFKSPTELADHLIKYAYKPSEEYQYNKSNFGYTGFKAVNKNDPQGIGKAKPASYGDFSPSPNGFTPLHVAVLENDLDHLKLAYKKKKSDINTKDKYECTPLLTAISLNRDPAIINFLLATPEISIETTSKDSSNPLMLAIKNKLPFEIIEQLINRMPQLDKKNKYGQNAVTLAVTIGNLTVLKALMQKGAKLEVEDNDTPSLLHLAIESNQLPIVEYLLTILDKKAILKVNEAGRNYLHQSYQQQKLDIANILKKNKHFAPILNNTDLHGKTVDQINKAPYKDFSIAILNDQLDNHSPFRIDTDEYIYYDVEWQWLFQEYAANNQLNIFFAMLRAIAEWDTTGSQLKNKPQSVELQAKYQTLGQIFDIVNYRLKQFNENIHLNNSFVINYTQSQLATPRSEQNQLINKFYYNNNLIDNAQLSEITQIVIKYPPNTIINITINNQHISAVIMSDGLIQVYSTKFTDKLLPFKNGKEFSEYLATVFDKTPFPKQFLFEGFTTVKAQGYVPGIDKVNLELDPKTSPNGFSELHIAVLENDIAKINVLIKANSQLLAKTDKQGNTALQLAIMKGCDENIIDLFLAQKPIMTNITNNGDDVLTLAFKNSLEYKMIKKILEHINNNLNPVEQSALLNKKSDNNPLILALKNAVNKPILDLLLANNYLDVNVQATQGNTPLMCALIHKQSSDVIFSLCRDKRIDFNLINTKGQNALMVGLAQETDEDDLDEIISHSNINHADHENKNALYYALENNVEFSTIVQLVKKGVDLNTAETKNGWTPLYLAVEMGLTTKTIQLLLLSGCDINKANKLGLTPLMQAIMDNRKDIFDLLLEAKADITIKDNFAKSALDYARLYTPNLVPALSPQKASVIQKSLAPQQVVELPKMPMFQQSKIEEPKFEKQPISPQKPSIKELTSKIEKIQVGDTKIKKPKT